jgi:hypothetical protein
MQEGTAVADAREPVYPLRTRGIWWLHGRGVCGPGGRQRQVMSSGWDRVGEHPARAALGRLGRHLQHALDPDAGALPGAAPAPRTPAQRRAGGCST